MWDLIVSVPDHCLSFYFRMQYTYTHVDKNLRHLLNRTQKSDPLRAMKTFIRKKTGHTT